MGGRRRERRAVGRTMTDELCFDPPEDAAVLTAELLIVAYVRTDGTNGYMVQARGEMPATTYLGMTVMAQDEIKEWGR
jgi:uncharacterized OB-fold protein